MSKRKKKSPLRNDFTDALNVEIAERKIIERTQQSNEETLQKAVTLEKSVVVEKISVEPPVEVTVKNEVEEITPPPVEKPQIVEIEVDKKLEERILKEADNDFFDEKPVEVKSPKVSTTKTEKAEKPPRSSIYHSKAMQRWEEEQEEQKESKKILAPEIDAPKTETPRRLSRPEKFGVIISVVMLIYAFANFDKPLFFLAMSLFVNFLRPAIGAMFGKHSDAVQNALHTFSIVVFFGAVMFLFI